MLLLKESDVLKAELEQIRNDKETLQVNVLFLYLDDLAKKYDTYYYDI